MRTTIRLSDELLVQAKKEAVRQQRTLTSLIEEGLRVVLAPKKDQRGKRYELPVSCATGGLQDGVDLNRSAELLELIDAE